MAAPTEIAALVAEIPVPPSAVGAEEAPRTRLCGRCRKPSDRDPAEPPAATPGFWLCPPCRDALIGGVGRGRQS